MNKNILDQNIPSKLYKYSQQFTLVLSMAITAVAFIIIFHPFNIYDSLDQETLNELPHWLVSAGDPFYVALSTMVIIGMAIIITSRMIMVMCKNFALTYKSYLIWCLVEFIVVSIMITICSTLMFHPEDEPIKLFFKVFGRTSCILFIPYTFCLLYIIIIDKAQQLKALHDSIKNDDIAKQRSYVLFYDDHNEMRLSIKREDVILIESADNYVCIWYTSGNDVKKTMIRNTMKWVEKQLVDSSIQRCHRSYMINMDRVKILRRDKDGVFIEFGIEGVFDVPISRTYIQNITSWLMK